MNPMTTTTQNALETGGNRFEGNVSTPTSTKEQDAMNSTENTKVTSTGHKIEAFKRGTGYAAHCTCGGATFGGFPTKKEAKEALEHETKAQPASELKKLTIEVSPMPLTPPRESAHGECSKECGPFGPGLIDIVYSAYVNTGMRDTFMPRWSHHLGARINRDLTRLLNEVDQTKVVEVERVLDILSTWGRGEVAAREYIAAQIPTVPFPDPAKGLPKWHQGQPVPFDLDAADTFTRVVKAADREDPDVYIELIQDVHGAGPVIDAGLSVQVLIDDEGIIGTPEEIAAECRSLATQLLFAAERLDGASR